MEELVGAVRFSGNTSSSTSTTGGGEISSMARDGASGAEIAEIVACQSIVFGKDLVHARTHACTHARTHEAGNGQRLSVVDTREETFAALGR